jgi:chorismate-pyruvate lyase
MDGTVTKSLEAWFWEPVNIVAKHNDKIVLNEVVSGLEARIGDNVLHRQVSLCGEKSKTIFATAESIVSLQDLPEDIEHSLIKGDIGIGELLRDKELETYRDIFDINFYPQDLSHNETFDELEGDIVSRSYRIWVNGKPAIIVSEFFPVDLYKIQRKS